MNRVSTGRTGARGQTEAARKQRFEQLKGTTAGFWAWMRVELAGRELSSGEKTRFERVLERIKKGELSYADIKLGRSQAMTAVYLYLKTGEAVEKGQLSSMVTKGKT